MFSFSPSHRSKTLARRRSLRHLLTSPPCEYLSWPEVIVRSRTDCIMLGNTIPRDLQNESGSSVQRLRRANQDRRVVQIACRTIPGANDNSSQRIHRIASVTGRSREADAALSFQSELF